MLKKLFSALFITAVLYGGAAAQEVEVDRYNINARLDAAASAVDVRAALNITNLGQSSKSRLYFRLTKLAKVASATVDGAAAEVETSDDRRVTSLSQVVVSPRSAVGAGAKATVELSYRIEAPESTPLLHIYSGEVLLTPESVWFPMPSTMFTLYGATTAPFTLTLSSSQGGNFRALASGTLKSEGGQSTFDQPLNSLPLVVAGNFGEPIISETGGVKIEIFVQPGIAAVSADAKPADSPAITSRMSDEAGRIIDFLTRTLGPPPAGATFRIISSVRAGNLTEPGVLVLNEQVFRRDTLSAGTIEVLADALARMWLEGRVRLRGQEARPAGETRAAVKARSAAFLSDSIPRYLAALYFEDRFSISSASDLFTRMRWGYTPVAQSGRDAELALQTVLLPNYSAAVLNKGPLVLRLLAETAGRGKLITAIKSVFSGPPSRVVTIEDLRAALIKDASPEVERVFGQWVDSIIEPDIIIGAALPSDKPGTQKINLRNLGTGDVRVTVLAVTASGKRLTTTVLVESENLATAEINTSEKISFVEVDPEKLIIQSNYDNDARDAESRTTRASAQTLLTEGIVAFNKTQYAEAEAKLREALRADQRNAVLHSWLARTLVAQKKLDEAASEANAAIRTDPPVGSALAWARVCLGQIAMARNQAAEAARQFRAAVVEADETAAQLAAHEGLIEAERAAGSSPPVDPSVRAFITALDEAIKEPASDKLFTLVIRNNLKRFVQGLTVTRPASWVTEILRVERIDSGRVSVDVGLKVRSEGRDQSGTAVYVLARVGNAWQLEDVPHALFNVK
jgi:tetratricopeptide (TPR) repeat protein